jgi:hypothetical protein
LYLVKKCMHISTRHAMKRTSMPEEKFNENEYVKVLEAVARRVSDTLTAEAAELNELRETGTISAEALEAAILRIADVMQAGAVELREVVEGVRSKR